MHDFSDTPACGRCGRSLATALRFGMKAPSGDSLRCLTCALRHMPMIRRSLAPALIVGSILVALNQGDILFLGHWANELSWKMPLTYLTPFLVATWGALSNARR